jgi:hypothetical protein
MDAHIESTLDWPLNWMRVARSHVDAARIARATYESDNSGALQGEFEAALVALAAAAFAVEAAQIRKWNGRPTPNNKPPKQAWDQNTGDWLGQMLVEAKAIDATTAENLGRFFDLRNGSLHPETVQVALTKHPVGTNTSPELVAYNIDVVEPYVDLANFVIGLVSHVK